LKFISGLLLLKGLLKKTLFLSCKFWLEKIEFFSSLIAKELLEVLLFIFSWFFDFAFSFD
jgi:hypothetical protein